VSRDEPGGYPFTAQAVSGMKAARELGPGSGVERANLSSRVRGAASGAVVARGRLWKGEPQAADPQGVEY
jgi:hypothetical protein